MDSNWSSASNCRRDERPSTRSNELLFSPSRFLPSAVVSGHSSLFQHTEVDRRNFSSV
jgi:hypothetical protein